MKISSGVPAPMPSVSNEAARLQKKIAVLKKALESHEQATSRIERMIEHKGQVIDLRA